MHPTLRDGWRLHVRALRSDELRVNDVNIFREYPIGGAFDSLGRLTVGFVSSHSASQQHAIYFRRYGVDGEGLCASTLVASGPHTAFLARNGAMSVNPAPGGNMVFTWRALAHGPTFLRVFAADGTSLASRIKCDLPL